MTTTDKLLPCPFCGGEAMIFRGTEACCKDDECAGWTVNRCNIAAWNRRASQAAPAPSDAPKPIAEFGHGTLVVDTGHHYGTPAVFVGPSQRVGPVGGLVPNDEKMPKDRLIEGEFFFTFPTDDQAKRVADAMVNAPAPYDALREALERLEAKASAVSSAHARKGNIGFAVAEMGPTIMSARAALSTPAEERT